jgi:hypothetical protein
LKPDEILAFAALAMTISDRLLLARIGPVANAILVQDSTGFDLSGFTHAIDNYGIRHTMKQHGSAAREQARGQVAVVLDDFGLIPSITLEPDSVFHDGKNRIGRDVIVFTKTISGVGYWYAAEIRAGKRVVATDSLRKKEGPWKAPRGAPATSACCLAAPSLNVRNDFAGVEKVYLTSHAPATPRFGRVPGHLPAIIRPTSTRRPAAAVASRQAAPCPDR